MCRLQAKLRWDDRMHVIPPLAGPLVAFIGMLIELSVVAR